jgi:multidrug efflux pump subunit AcrB
VILTFLLHGISLIGFFTMIGVIGLCGVVINDSIVMVNKMDLVFDEEKGDTKRRVARAASSRLRAVILTTLTTVAGVMPTAYGIAGYDSMLAEMMLALSWGLIFGTLITLVFVPCAYSILRDYVKKGAPPASHA